jgi:hypothetical protein
MAKACPGEVGDGAKTANFNRESRSILQHVNMIVNTYAVPNIYMRIDKRSRNSAEIGDRRDPNDGAAREPQQYMIPAFFIARKF